MEHENCFGESGELGQSSPACLQDTVFYYVGMHFVLRGIQEEYDLVPQQFQRNPPDCSIYNVDVYYRYTEYISKNNQHHFKGGKVCNKEVRAYAQLGLPWCVVKLFDIYLSKLPVGANYFYLRPLKEFPSVESKPWYGRQRVGVNKLKEIVSRISSTSGISTRYTNHSLRATAVTRMF